MSAVRRLPIVLGLALAVLIGEIFPASATFTDTAAASTEMDTIRVQEPTSLSGQLTCGGSTSIMSLTWKTSTTARVSHQQVKVYISDGSVQTFDVSPTATSWSAEIDTSYVTAHSIDLAVTAVTDYGWYRESSKQGQFHC